MAEETDFFVRDLLPAIAEAEWEQVGKQGNSRLFRKKGETDRRKDLHIPYPNNYKLKPHELEWFVRKFGLGQVPKK